MFISNFSYNQNFHGDYCICHRPYPDPEDPVSDEMIQCFACEDWFHSRHLGKAEEDCKDKSDMVDKDFSIPSDSSYAEMICVGCVKKLPFLMVYEGQAGAVVANAGSKDKNDSVASVDVEAGSDDGPSEAKKMKADQDKTTKDGESLVNIFNSSA